MIDPKLSTPASNSRMEIEEPLKTTRDRAETLDYSSPPPKSLLETGCRQTTDTFKSLGKYYSNGKDTDEVFFDGALEKLSGVHFGRFLDKHGIKEKFRAKMVDWMFEVLTIYQQKDSTVFKSVFLLDLYYANKKETEALEELHLLGMVCMMIASKSDEVKFIKLDAFINTIGRGKFSKEQILAKEIEVLRTIGFRTSFPTIHELLKCTFRLIDAKESSAFFQKSALILAKMCLCSYEMLTSLSPKEISLCCIIISLKLSEKIAGFDSTSCIKKALEIFGVEESPVIYKKVQLVHSYVVNFGGIMPYVKNIGSFEDFESQKRQ